MTPIPIHPSWFFPLVDVSGVFAGALAGALAAKRNATYQFDFVGVIGLGFITALGGGITRDVLLQHGPPLAFTDIRYLELALAGAVLGLLLGTGPMRRIGRALNLVDALALGFFAVAGVTRAEGAGLTLLPALLMGIVTAVGGGALGDVFSGRSPKVFERGEPYALVAAIVAVLFVAFEHWTGNAQLSTLASMTAGFVIRVLALRYEWKTSAVR